MPALLRGCQMVNGCGAISWAVALALKNARTAWFFARPSVPIQAPKPCIAVHAGSVTAHFFPGGRHAGALRRHDAAANRLKPRALPLRVASGAIAAARAQKLQTRFANFNDPEGGGKPVEASSHIAPADAPAENDRTALTTESLKRAFLDNLFYMQGKFPALATRNDYYMALAYVVRDRLLQRWVSTANAYTRQGSRTVAYLSAEFLMGPHLGNNLINLGIYEQVKLAVAELGLDFDELLQQEEEPGLGNGGLGRLAACFLDSLATLEIPTLGYGIRYEFGIFHQDIVDGWQVEKTDKWLCHGNPWELIRPEWAVQVGFGGHTERYTDERGRARVRWMPNKIVNGIPYDTPILGYRTHTANTLRLWRAEAPESFDFAVFNRGDYYGAVNKKIVSENLSKVLYPNDEPTQGKELRLEQQFFLCRARSRTCCASCERSGYRSSGSTKSSRCS